MYIRARALEVELCGTAPPASLTPPCFPFVFSLVGGRRVYKHKAKESRKERAVLIAHHTPRTVRPVHIERLAAPGQANNKEL